MLLDRYELVGRIGEGATSAVWEALDRRTQERVAIKAISLDAAGWRAEVRDRFQQEARLLAETRDQHLVAVRDMGETDDGYLFTVLDKLSGETLAARMAHPPRIAWREAARIALQIARGLAALHARGVVHRDIKPANVILHLEGPPGSQPIAKIIDLGVSKVRVAAADPVLYETLTATGQVLGTPEYMSYEQALGERDIDVRSDIWAVGVVLYEMLAGKRPFDAPNVNAVLAAIRRGVVTSLADTAKGTPAPLLEVVARCLERPREARFADGAELALAIEVAMAEAERTPDAPMLPLPRPARLGSIGLGAVLAAAAAIGLYLLVSTPPSAGTDDTRSAASPPSAAPPASPPAPPPPRLEQDVDAAPATSTSAVPGALASVRPAPSRPVTKVNDAGF